MTHLQAELGPSEEETNLLLAITLSEGRYETYIARKPMTFGRQLSPGSAVFVEVKGHSNVLPGIVQYKGTVRYIGKEVDSAGNVYIVAGLELVGIHNFLLNCTCLCRCIVLLKSKFTILTQNY